MGQFSKKNEQIPIIQSQTSSLKKRVARLEGFLEDLEESKKQLGSIRKEIEEVQRQLPEEIRDTDLLDLFSREAETMNIKDIILQPRAESKRGIYVAKEYELKATGTYLQFLVYFERLEKNPRLIDVVELSMISSSDEKSRGRFKLIDVTAKLEVFRYDVNVGDVKPEKAEKEKG